MKKAFLFLLGLIAFIGVQAQTSPYAGNEVAAGDFFLYNVESGLWLQNNDGRNTGDYNTRGAVGSYGFEFGISVEGAGWKLDPKFGHNHSMNSSNFYLDTGDDVTVWTIEPKTVDGVTNAYTIKAGDQILGLDENENIAWTDVKSTWQLVTRADRLAYLKANASAENPIDATFLIMDPGFTNENERGGAWKWEQDGGNRDDVRPIWCRRSYAIWNSNSFKISQQIADIPNGSYKLTVKGYYRDGDRDQVVARRNEGNERILANYFLNSDKAPFMSILDGASDEWMDGTFYYPGANDDAPYGHYPDNADAFSRIFQNYPNAYQNAGVVSVVTTKSMTIGIEKLEKNDRDWLAWDDFRLIYMGSNIDIAAMQEALQKAITQATDWDASNTSTDLATALNTVISESEAKLTSTDEDELSAATAAVNEALSKAQALNVSTLKQFIAFGQKFGVDVTEANNAVENAQTADEVNVALLNLPGAIKVKAQTVADIYTGVAPAAGEFYLFNVGTGMWLNQGSDWCTHAAVDQAGLLITFEESGAGFVFRTPWGTFNNSPYTDTPVTTVYTFQAVDGKDGVYNILEGNRLLGWNPQGHTDGEKYWSSISNTEGADPADPNFQWKVVSKAERDELLAKATKAAPVDATYLINNPSLMRQPGYDMWSKEVNGGNGGTRVDNKGGDRSPDFAWEYYDTNSFKFYQELEGLTPGLYEVSATAFYRDGNGGYQAGVVNDGGELLQLAYLFGNDAQTPLPNIASVTDFVPGVATQASSKGSFPNWPREAIEYFEYGAYKVTVKAVVGEDGKLSFGIAKDSKSNDGDWVVLDNFRLTFLGGASDYDLAMAAIKDGQSYRVFTEVDNQKYYLTPDGYLADDAQKAGTFTFKMVPGAEYEYGFQLLDAYFTNPPTGGNPVLNNGHIATDANSKRNDWEAQVFFLNSEGKYAVRATNAAGGTSGWPLNATAFWTVNAGPVAEYSFDKNYIWQIEENVDNRPELLAQIKPITDSWAAKMQQIGGLVTDASQFSANSIANESIGLAGLSDGDYNTYFHSQWGNSGVTEAHYLQAELPDAADKFYFYFVKRDPVNNANVNNRPTDILISGSNDGTNFTEITEITEGLPAAVPPIDYMSGLISANEAYKFIRFTVLDTNNHGADNNGNKFFTFSEFYILPSDELFDEAASLMFANYTDIPLEGTDDLLDRVNAVNEKLNGFFKDVELNLVLNDQILAITEATILIGNEAPAAPASFYNNEDVKAAYNGLVFFKRDVDKITDETTAVNYTAESAISESFEYAKWFNMNIRGNYWVAMDDTEPYYPTADKDLEAEASQWAFGAVEGQPNQIIIWNRAAGPDKSLQNTGESDPVESKPLVAMRDGQAAWDFAINADGFVIHQVGTGENEWVNQNGGTTGPFSIWNSGNAKGDAGSTLRISFVEEVAEDASPEAAYERALAAIEDGANYRVYTVVDGEKFYVTEGGLLTAVTDEGGIFTFNQKENTGNKYMQYGYQIDSGTKRFTNPPLANNVANLNPGSFATSTNNRIDWETQVLFLTGGKYAIRSCNVPDGTSSWNDAGRTYWTFAVEEAPAPQYTYDPTYVWQLEGPLSIINVAYQLYEADGETAVGNPVTKKQEVNSTVQIPSSINGLDYNGGWAPYAYYDYTTEGTIADADCTIKVIRTPASGVVHALTDLSNNKAYTIRCDRGALLTNGETIGSTSHADLHNAAPGEFAVISYDGNYYLYSVADQKFVLNTGSLSEMPTNGVFDAIQMGAQTDPYFLFTFKIDDATTYGLNTNGTGALNGCVINSWTTPDQGDQYYMIEAADFDPTAAIAALDAYFNPTHFVTYVVKDAEGNTLFTSDAVPAIPGSTITALPAEYQRAFTTYNEVEVPITEEQTTAEFTATSTFPFELSASFDEAKWYNMTIRSSYYVAKDETEPYYPTTDKDLYAPESEWAFTGDVYNGIVVFNKAAGEGWSLTKDGSNVVMREGAYAWTIGENSDGFTLREMGTDNNCINQNGGSTGPLQFWNSGGALTDDGSTFRVAPVPTVKTFAINVDREVGMGYTPTIATVAADDLEAAKQFLGVSELTTDMLDIVNPDGTVVFDYATYDGWFNAEGVATTWGENTAVCVKFFQALPDGAFEICDMNGADQVDKTYKVTWEFQANGKAAWFEVYVTFVKAPTPELEIVKTIEGGSIEYASSEASYVEKSIVLTDEQVAEILAALEIESLDQATAYGWNPTTQELVANFAGYDGWRKADGDFANWSGDATVPACLKYTDGKTYLTYNINGVEAQTIKVYWAIGTAEKAVLVEFSFIYTSDAAGQDFAGAIEQTVYNRNTGEALPGATDSGEQTVSIAPAEDGKVNITFSGFTMPMLAMEVPEFTVTATATPNEDGSISYSAEEFTVAMQKGQMTINYTGTLEGIQANADAVPGLHLMLTQAAIDEVYFAADAEAIEALKEIFEPVPVAINGINADQLNGTIYDLGGRKLEKVQRGGVYIVNGKKVAVK